MNEYWSEQRNAVQDGGKLRSDQACALFDYIADLERAFHFLVNEPLSLHRWMDLKTMLDTSAREPE